MPLLDILIYVGVFTFVVGWLVVIVDAVTGFRVIERIPAAITSGFGAIHNGSLIAIAVILSAGLFWHLATG